ncbi:MAG: Mrp/NBP35 family ATP-binding protein, partial [Anaerolineae bacterium]|nr:Mrp/NBP35 family ATP-binding protein [Anaerolineae bacterium]
MKNFLSRAFTTAKHRVMVVSAKGGVGKSTMTVNLAAALTARGFKVGIFDADIHGPNVPALLGIRQKRNLLSGANPAAMMPVYVSGGGALDMRPIKPFSRYGIQVMSLALLVGEEQMLNPQPQEIGTMVELMLGRVDWGSADVILIDMPPGTGEPLQTIIQNELVDGVVLVAVREQLAHMDNGRLLSFLRTTPIPIFGVVENMTHVICPRCGELIELYPAPASEEAIYGDTPVLGAIPFHHDLIRQVRGGAPLPLTEPDSPVARILLGLADQVMEKLNG